MYVNNSFYSNEQSLEKQKFIAYHHQMFSRAVSANKPCAGRRKYLEMLGGFKEWSAH